MTTEPSGQPAHGSLIGRHEELQAFRHALDRVAGGHAAVLVVHGDAGSGRTRLMQEFSVLARDRHAHVLASQPTGLRDAPLAGFRSAALDAGPLETVRQVLIAPGDGDDRFGRVIQALATAARSAPAWIFIDNVDTVDETSRKLADRLLAAIVHGSLSHHPVGLVLSLSGRLPPPLTIAGDSRQPDFGPIKLELRPFDTQEITAWLASRFRVEPEVDLVQLLARASAGNPLMLVELAGHLQRSGLLRTLQGRLASNVDPHAIELPGTLTSLLESRTQAVSGACHRALTLAASLGSEFDPQTLAELLGESPAALARALAEAEQASLIERCNETLLAFTHTSARDFFYATPSRRRRQAAHLEIARRLIDEFAEAPDEHALTITHHLVAAGADADPSTVVHFAPLAGRTAFEHHAYALAGRYFEAAAEAATGIVSPQDRAQLYCRAGEAYQRWSDGARSVACFEHAVQLFESCDDRVGCAVALQGLLRNHIKFGEPDGQASTVADRLEALLPELPADAFDVRVNVNDTLASHYYALGEFTIAEAYAQTAMDIAVIEAADPALRCVPVTSLALAQLDQLRPVDAKTTWLQGLTYDRAARATRYEGLHLQRLPVPLYCMGAVEEALYYNKASYAHNRSIDNTAQFCMNYTMDVLIANLRGDFESAVSTGYRCLDLMTSTRYLWAAPALVASLSCALTMLERYDDAERVIGHLATPGLLFEDTAPYRRVTTGLIALVATQRDGRLPSPSGAATQDRQGNARGVRIGNAGLMCCEVELALFGHRAAHSSESHDLLGMLHRRGVALTLDWCFSVPRSLGVSAALRGDALAADVHFRDAEDLAQRCGAPIERARVELYRALAACACGEPDLTQVRSDLDSALTTFARYRSPVLVRLAEDARSAIA